MIDNLELYKMDYSTVDFSEMFISKKPFEGSVNEIQTQVNLDSIFTYQTYQPLNSASTINGQAVYGYSNTGIYFQSMFPEPNFNDDL
jgi:hypothetical protein